MIEAPPQGYLGSLCEQMRPALAANIMKGRLSKRYSTIRKMVDLPSRSFEKQEEGGCWDIYRACFQKNDDRILPKGKGIIAARCEAPSYLEMDILSWKKGTG